MANTGLLVLTNPIRIRKLLPVITKHVLKTLYIQYYPEKNISVSKDYNVHIGIPERKGFHYSKDITDIYVNTSTIASQLDIRVLLTKLKCFNTHVINTKKPVDIVIFDEEYSKKETDTFIENCVANKSTDYSFITCNDKHNEDDHKNLEYNVQNDKMYNNVILGGTFDRLHNGHKILLSIAVLHCTEALTVGVTDTNMLSGKLLWELIEPCVQRINRVKEFLEDVDPSIAYNVVPINDIYGPTKDDPSLQMLVVSEETKRGGAKVNELRLQRDLSKLDILVVELAIDGDHNEDEENKISSSNHRMRLLGTRLRPPRLNNKPLKPYIIGLTGGITSGKSSVAEKLQKLGAGFVNCDEIGHNLYLPGRDCFNVIIEQFGTSVLGPDGLINRKALANIVFNNKEHMEKFNNLMWPLILREAKKEIAVLYSKGYNIIVMEAALLIQAKWQDACHDIWTCIIPQDEAIKRVMNRNGLSEQIAKSRVAVQPSNVDQVKEANIVICTLWSHDNTQKQVKKAWQELTTSLSNKL